MKERRLAKISTLLKQELSTLINNDFGEAYGIISVVDVIVASDFESAKVYISLFDENLIEKLLKVLKSKIPLYQRALADKLKMRSTPKLVFKTDFYQEKLDRVDELLKETNHGN
jgi:ribosome-binding factor A